MKHYLIVYESKTATAVLKEQLLLQGNVVVHTVSSAAGIRPLLLAFPVSVVFVGVGMWDYRAMKGMQVTPVIVVLCGPREFMKEELLGSGATRIPYLKEPFAAKDVHGLRTSLPKLYPQASTEFMFIKFDRRWRKIMFEDILAIEKKDGMYSMIHTQVGNLMVLSRLESWLEQLPPDGFVRVADGLILPVAESKKVVGDVYHFKGRDIKLSFKFLKPRRREESKQKPGLKSTIL